MGILCVFRKKKKAFDKVSHDRLVWKLENMRIRWKKIDGKLLKGKGNENGSKRCKIKMEKSR